MTRLAPPFLVLLTLVSAVDAAAERRRAVRSPAHQCAFSLSVSFGTHVTSDGFENGAVQVIGSPSTCTFWNAYSLTEWATVERVANSVLVDVAPNPTHVPRSAMLLIAGIRYEFTQDGAPLISPPVDTNIVKNPGFDRDLSFWGWRDEFPNGTGSDAWSSSDANANPNSGSIRLRNTRAPGASGHTFQRLQCVAVEGGQSYDFGGKFRAPSTNGNAVFAVVEYTGENCDTGAIAPSAIVARVRAPNTWESALRTHRMSPDTKSAFMIIGSLATVSGTFELLIDDVFLKTR